MCAALQVLPPHSRPLTTLAQHKALHVVSVKLHHLEQRHRQTSSRCPRTARRQEKGKYLAGVNKAKMRSLTFFLEERGCIASITPAV